MGRIEFTSENKVATTNYDYPKLKLKNGERARILLLEAPVREYVHTLRAPQIVDGEAKMFMNERKDKTKYEDYVMDFLSRPLCLGDASILADKGADPKNCPMCELAKSNPDMTSAPQRRYAMHVIRYRTKSGGWDLITPYSVETLVWSFTDKIFNQIADFKEEWTDLRKHDLTLGPCENETFQKFSLSVSAKAAWMEDKERMQLTMDTFRENQIPDLAIACGSLKEKKWVEDDIEKIKANWAIATGSKAKSAPLDTASLDDDLSSLLDSRSSKSDSTADFDDLLSKEDTPYPATPAATKAAPKAKAAAKTKAAAKVEEEVDPLDGLLDEEPGAEAEEAAGDFDDLLASL